MSDASIVLALAKSNGVYRRAVESDPRFVRACQVRQQVLAVQLKLPAVQRPESPIKSELPLSDWLDARVAVDSAERAREVKLTALRALLRDCESEITTAATIDPDRLLRCFADELDELFNDMEPVVQRLGGATSPGEAVDVGDGGVTAWRQLPPLRARYDEIRRAQWEVMKTDHTRRQNSQSPVFGDQIATDLVASNWDDTFPTWRQKDTTVYVFGEAPDRRPWPNDPVAQLVWMITSGLEMWVPTRAEIDALHAERQRRRNPVPKDQRRIGPGWTIPDDAFGEGAPWPTATGK